jgi:hypothetical protein
MSTRVPSTVRTICSRSMPAGSPDRPDDETDIGGRPAQHQPVRRPPVRASSGGSAACCRRRRAAKEGGDGGNASAGDRHHGVSSGLPRSSASGWRSSVSARWRSASAARVSSCSAARRSCCSGASLGQQAARVGDGGARFGHGLLRFADTVSRTSFARGRRVADQGFGAFDGTRQAGDGAARFLTRFHPAAGGRAWSAMRRKRGSAVRPGCRAGSAAAADELPSDCGRCDDGKKSIAT